MNAVAEEIRLASKAPFANSAEIVRSVAELFRPPRRLAPVDAATQFLRNEKGAWEPELAPMMHEPMNLLASRMYNGIIFVGPARCSKTFSLILGGITFVVTCAPGDMLVTQMSQEAARDFSRGDLDRSIRHSSELGARLSPRARDDNTFDKFFRSGVSLKLGWPAVSQLSSKTIQYIFITDYDRPENRDDVEGEGPLWDLAAKRTETYMSRGKCLAESSPGEEMSDLGSWKATTPHEAPPTLGILSLYNRGTRARWYWPCAHCGEFFQAKPGTEPFHLPPFDEIEKLVKTEDHMQLAERFAQVPCPKCGAIHSMQDRYSMNLRGRWVHEGERMGAGGVVQGERRRTNIASYWLGGVAATYQRWDSMLLKYFQAVANYLRTSDESAIKSCVSLDFGAPYEPRRAAKKRAADEFMQRSEEWMQGTVPEGVRFLIAAVDVQAHSFVVQVYGFGAGLESWVVDRYKITSSKRPEGDRTAALDPGSYIEDWHLIFEEVMQRTYPLEKHPSLKLATKLTVCDSGGRDGVTQHAYDYWRILRAKNLHSRFVLVKGDGRPTAPRAQLTWPDAKGRYGKQYARGDVPVWMLNVNVLKDAVWNDITRDQQGPGFVHLPKWMETEFFIELTAEVRGEKGWERQKGARNEAFDLHVYARAGCVMLKAEQIDWERPPEWARPPHERADSLQREAIQLDPRASDERKKERSQRLQELGRSLNQGT